MKKNILFLLIWSITAISFFAQSPQAFQYQAVLRNSAGEILSEQNVTLRVSILKESINGTAIYVEVHSSIATNKFGLVNLQIGKGNSENSFKNINWADGLYFLKIELDPAGGTNFQHLGTSQLLSVPYAIYAESAGSVKTVVAKEDHDPEEPIFQVKNKEGQVLFAIYESGVIVNINEDAAAKGSRSGFAVGGFSSQKQNGVTDYLTVERDNVKVYLEDDVTKSSRGGFAVGGFSSQNKEISQNFLQLTPDYLSILLDQDYVSGKGSKGGFAVGGFSGGNKDLTAMDTISFLHINSDSTRIWFNNDTSKGSKGGFAVGGFSSQKSTSPADFLFEVTIDTIYLSNTVTALKNIQVEGNLSLGGVIDEPTFTDSRDGRKYKWAQIGDQFWMAENLRYDVSGAVSYDNDIAYSDTVGYMYPWSVATGGIASESIPSGVQGICPAGWHIPSLIEWEVLINHLGGELLAGNTLKSSSPVWDGTNSSRFSAKPGGVAYYSDFNLEISFYDYGFITGFWTTNEEFSEGITHLYINLQSGGQDVSVNYSYDDFGDYGLQYVRCIKD